ncbi:hypothetical protein KFE98_17860 [bacterium SCSIO 12741]|nr:hypothetical protein KFE98_17860 [bacterium SCSIO 12741]
MQLSQWLSGVISIAPLFVLLPLGLSWVLYGRLDKPLRWLSWLMVVSAVTALIAHLLWKEKINNLPILHVYTNLEFLMLSLYFYWRLKPMLSPRVLILIILFFFGYSLVNSFFFQHIYENNSNARALESILLIFFSLLLFYKFIREARIVRLEQTPEFWINSAVLLYFSGSFFLFVFSNYVVNMKREWATVFWGVHAIFYVIYLLLISIGLWKVRRNTEYIS